MSVDDWPLYTNRDRHSKYSYDDGRHLQECLGTTCAVGHFRELYVEEGNRNGTWGCCALSYSIFFTPIPSVWSPTSSKPDAAVTLLRQPSIYNVLSPFAASAHHQHHQQWQRLSQENGKRLIWVSSWQLSRTISAVEMCRPSCRSTTYRSPQCEWEQRNCWKRQAVMQV